MDLGEIDIELFKKESADTDLNVLSTPYDNHNSQGAVRRHLECRKLRHEIHSFNAMIWKDWQTTKLRSAASFNNVEGVELHIRNGACVNSADEQGRTALHIAASRGYADVVKALIRGGADPNSEDKLGNTPLHLAVYTGSIETVSHLLSGGSRIRRTQKLPYTPLELARSKLFLLSRQGDCSTAKSQVQEITRLLLERVVNGFYDKITTEVEVDNVLKSLSTLDLESPSSSATLQ